MFSPTPTGIGRGQSAAVLPDKLVGKIPLADVFRIPMPVETRRRLLLIVDGQTDILQFDNKHLPVVWHTENFGIHFAGHLPAVEVADNNPPDTDRRLHSLPTSHRHLLKI